MGADPSPQKPAPKSTLGQRSHFSSKVGCCRNVGGFSTSAAGVSASNGAQTVLAADNFETEVGSIEEDKVRRQALQDYMPIVPPVGWANIGAVLKQAAAFMIGFEFRDLAKSNSDRANALIDERTSDDATSSTNSATHKSSLAKEGVADA